MKLEAGAAAREAALIRSASRGPWHEAWRRLRRNKVALACLAIVLLMFGAGIFAPWVAPYSYSAQNLANAQQPPSLTHPFGTDTYGRDILSRVIWGARTASLVATMPVGVALIMGVVLGAMAGYFGGWIDSAIMRLTDFFLAFPGLLFAILLAATVRPRIVDLVRELEGPLGMPGLARSGMVDYLAILLILSTIGWMGLARLIRGQVLTIKNREFVEAARTVGASEWRVIFRHILPNTLGLIIVVVSSSMAGAIMAESVLSFVGLGIKDPTPSWGVMIQQDYGYWRTRPHLVFVPGAVVATIVYAFNLLGDGLNDAFNPRTR